MSLVDYGSSDDDDEEKAGIGEEKGEDGKPDESGPQMAPAPSLRPPVVQNRSFAPPLQQSHNAPPAPPSIELPDASMLLDSPDFSSHQISGSDHSSRVAAAMVERASQKRESNGSALQYPRSKHPRGNLPHSRNLPDTVGGLLIPPQLHGRSNVVTEDVNKLFVNRRTEPSG